MTVSLADEHHISHVAFGADASGPSPQVLACCKLRCYCSGALFEVLIAGMASILCLRSLQYRPLADCIRCSSSPMTAMVEQDSGDYAGYEQALQNGFAKVIKAPKKVCHARVLFMACLLYVH